jgi:hypothetical protein
MFQALRNRFSTDDAAKAEKKGRKAETAAKRRDLKAQRQRKARERERQGGGGGGIGIS